MNLRGYIGKGRGYDSTRDWDAVEDLLDFQPYPGTLNIAIIPKLSEDEIFNNFDCINIFKDFKCIKGVIKNQDCYFCYSLKRGHEDVSTFYVLSENKLRDMFRLKDGNCVEFTLLNK